MSRIGNLPIQVPNGVTVSVDNSNQVMVKGPKGTLTQKVDADITISIENGIVSVKRPTEQKRHKSMHGLYRALINNMISGVTGGYTRELELVGVGYRASNVGQLLELQVGFSHPIVFYIPNEIKIETVTEKGSNPIVKLSGTDKQLLGQVAAKIRSFREPEPYKGKGIKYKEEILRRKAGKSGGKK